MPKTNRGGKSGTTSGGASGANGGQTSGGPRKISKASEAKSIEELRDYASKNYMITITKSAESVGLEHIKQACSDVEFIASEMPMAQYMLRTINGDESRGNAYASASLFGAIQFNPKNFGDDVRESYARDVKSGFHPDGTTYKNIMSHELGHTLTAFLIYKEHPGAEWTDRLARADDWNKGTTASNIVTEAVKIAKKTDSGKGLLTKTLIDQVSEYAGRNRMETVAECVADYIANRSNAKPLSVAVWQVMKERARKPIP